jgi:hypothetical protein
MFNLAIPMPKVCPVCGNVGIVKTKRKTYGPEQEIITNFECKCGYTANYKNSMPTPKTLWQKLFKQGPIRIRQEVLPSGYKWLETILLIDDVQAEKLSDWTVGYYHCIYCREYQGFAYKLPPKNKYGDSSVNPVAHNERNKFWRKHAHGDGRILMFEKDLPVNG